MSWFDALPSEVRAALIVLVVGVIYGAARWIKNRGDKQSLDIQELKDNAKTDKDARDFLHKTALEQQARLDKVEAENKELRAEITGLRTTKAANDRELEIRNKDLQAAHELLREMAEKFGNLNAKYDRAIFDNTKLTERVDGLEARQKERHAILDKAQESVQKAGVELLAAQKDLQVAQGERDAAQAALKTANELNAELSERVEKAETRIKEMQVEIDSLRAQVEASKDKPDVVEVAA